MHGAFDPLVYLKEQSGYSEAMQFICSNLTYICQQIHQEPFKSQFT